MHDWWSHAVKRMLGLGGHQGVQETAGVVTERPIVAVNGQEAFDLGGYCRDFATSGRRIFGVHQGPSFQTVKVDEHVAYVRFRVFFATSQPLQKGAGSVVDLGIGGPVTHVTTFSVRVCSVHGKGGVNQGRFCAPALERLQPTAEVDEPSRNGVPLMLDCPSAWNPNGICGDIGFFRK